MTTTYEQRNGYTIAHNPPLPKPTPEENLAQLTAEELEGLKEILEFKLGKENVQAELERARTERLEQKRLERLEREEWESLTPTERVEFESQYGPLTTLKRAVAHARRESDEHWMKSEQESQHNALIEWRKSKGTIKITDQQGHTWEQESPISQSDVSRKIAELSQAGGTRAEARLQARQRRELASEAHDNDIDRIWATLDADEQKIVRRILGQQPSELEKLQNFKAANRNPIEGIDDARTLYRIANQGPQRAEEWVEPESNIENVTDPKMLYKMARRQIEERQEQKEMRK